MRLQLTATAPTAACHSVGCPQPRSIVAYQRHVTDLPWEPRSVRIQLMVRKYVCRHPSDARRIFTGRLPELMAADARKTRRLIKVLQAIGTE
jgi:hypothetical protein